MRICWPPAPTRPSVRRRPRAPRRTRWVENYGSAPPGWPYEVGYWIGMRIWQSYYDAAVDKHAAIREMLTWDDPDLILQKSRYVGSSSTR